MMESAARAMLRRLGAGVRPDATSVRTNAPIERVGFDELVALARRGSIESGRSLDLARGAGPVDARTMELLSAVADAAQAAGFARVGALIDGVPEDEDAPVPVRAATIDVVARLVESIEDESAGRLIAGVDAFVRVPDVEPHALRELLSEDAGRARRESGVVALLGARPIENASLARALARE
ncbi:MAG: hypothetical protein Tsb0013_16150 [Phycisphaerales bacterium]